MSDIFDYMEWRGDIHMKQDTINDVDILILCGIAYIPFEEVVSGSIDGAPVLLGQAAEEVLRLVNAGSRKFHKKEDKQLLEKIMDCPRFRDIQLYYYQDIYSPECEEQFSAVTMELEDNTIAVVYRGTDGTLVGWKEDFNMSFSPQIPAQKDAVCYLESVAKRFPEKKLRIAGHSKGGNLSIYAATFCNADTQNRILAVRNLDGPGFNEYQAGTKDFERIAPITLTYMPNSSVIGMLLEHMEKSVIVSSQSMGLFQHDLYLWEIRRGDFIYKEEYSNSSQVIDLTLKSWLNSLTAEQRENMVDGFFEILQSSDGKTLRDLWHGRNVLTILSTAVKLNPETKSTLSMTIKLFAKALKNNIRARHAMDSLIEKQ